MLVFVVFFKYLLDCYDTCSLIATVPAEGELPHDALLPPLKGDPTHPITQVRVVTVLFCDVVNFTTGVFMP